MSVSPSEQHRTVDLNALMPMENIIRSVTNTIDPFGVTSSMLNACNAWMTHPTELARAINGISGDVLALQAHTFRRMMGLPSEDVVLPHSDDKRFSDPIWSESASWDILKEWYLAITHRLEDMCFATPGLSDKQQRRAAFWVRKWLNAISPTNFFFLNPPAMKRAIETKGESLRKGFEFFLRDLGKKNILTVDPEAFKLGVDLANTPGEVIFRNRLVELIHYKPTTEKVHAKPILICTPIINKFYILDLGAKKSMVKYLVEQGYSVFITSWKNPTSEMSGVRFDDYVTEGIDQAVRVVTDFCKVKKIHAVGYCIGGTLLSIYLAWANRRMKPEEVPVESWTTFTTLTDFSNPGEIDVFIDENCVRAIDEMMKKKGYLEGGEMASSFRLLRSNSLIWHYWVHSYLLGEQLPAFDVLYWNADSTRLPQAMHSYYLHEMYLNNNLIKRDCLTIAGEPIDLDRIKQPLYAVTAEDDHIAPWKQCYRIRKAININAPMRFVLSTSGHIMGIVNPPTNPPKRSYWVANPERNEHWELWFDRAEKRQGTWWSDWMQWLEPKMGEMVKAYPTSNKQYPKIEDAPGTYVLER